MRDRRNTNLSISTVSPSSASVSPIAVSSESDPEKGRFLLLPTKPETTDLPSPLIKAAAQEQARRPWHRKLAGNVTKTNIFFAALFTTLFIFRIVLLVTSLPALNLNRGTFVLADEGSLSGKPETVVVQNQHGIKRWTVSIPTNATFPLRPNQYRSICSTGQSMSKVLRQSAAQQNKHTSPLTDAYYAKDRYYMDVLDAESAGVLSSISSQPPIPAVGYSHPADGNAQRTCSRSLTFILETEEAGFGKSLLSLWLSYGLAQRENRAFFIDDSRWQYGKYLSFFPAPPMPSCAPPPASAIVPCPHQASHLAVSAATLGHVFGPKFNAYYHQPSSAIPHPTKKDPIFALARAGYKSLFALTGEDAAFATHRTTALRQQAAANAHPVVAVHIRRGDRHPFEFEFQNDYLPLERFTAAALAALPSGPRPKAANASEPIPLLVASDDPDIVASEDLSSVLDAAAAGREDAPVRLERAQERIVLASKRNLLPTVPLRQGRSAFVKHVDEVSGWEGGFFAPLFRGLGRPNKAEHLTFSSAREHRIQVEERLRKQRTMSEEVEGGRGAGGDGKAGDGLSEEERKKEENAAAMRELVGRGYLLDLAVMGSADEVVCAVSSATCRVLGVIMGQKKVARGEWRNVDDGRGWSWDGLH